VKYPRIELRTGRLHFILPPGYDLEAFFEKNKKWIARKTAFIKECLEKSSHHNLATRPAEEFKVLVYALADKNAKELKVTLHDINIRKMRSKWASLSSAGNITLNALLTYLPQHLIDYIIFHELAHIFEKRHNTRFWEIISPRYPDYQELEKALFTYWFLVFDKLSQ
jgi:predicted metal-dependent hydrolase